MAGIGSTRLLLLIGICWVPIIILGIFGFAMVLRRERKPSALSFAATPPVRLGTIELVNEAGVPFEIGFQWRNGAFVAEDGHTLAPTEIASLDAAAKVRWGSEQQRAWFQTRFVEGRPGPEAVAAVTPEAGAVAAEPAVTAQPAAPAEPEAPRPEAPGPETP